MSVPVSGVNRSAARGNPGPACYDPSPGETPSMPKTNDQTPPSDDRFTLAQAARLTGMPKAYLRELVESGRLAVHLIPDSGDVKQRVSRIGLIEAGLLTAESNDTPSSRTELGDLIALVREQSVRITTLEEQRFQIGAQLGAAIERVSALEDQILSLPHAANGLSDPRALAEEVGHEPAEGSYHDSDTRTSSSVRNAVARVSVIGVQRPAELGARVMLRGVRLFERSRRSLGSRR
jgi:hypothetical protein